MSTEVNDQSTEAQDNTNAEVNEDQNIQQSEEKANTVLTTEQGQEKDQVEEESKEEETKPGEYSDFTFPEGVSFDKEMLGKFTATAQELNLSQENAQRLVDLATEHTKEIVSKQQTEWGEIRKNWVESIKNDKEFGGEKFVESVERAKRTLNKYGSEDFINELDSMGFGDNPGLIKLLARVDRAMSEDKVVDGGVSGETSKSAAEIIFGNK